jgi:hypothetical protein
MRAEVSEAIRRAYVEAKRYEDPDYRLLSRDDAQAIVDEIRRECGANVTWGDDANYATSYQLEITHESVPTPSQRAAAGSGRTHLSGTHYLLSVGLSWLGPFAMHWWGRYEEGKDPVLVSEPEPEEERKLEACVRRILDDRGIMMLDEAELREPVDSVDLSTLDGENPFVASLLFARYL